MWRSIDNGQTWVPQAVPLAANYNFGKISGTSNNVQVIAYYPPNGDLRYIYRFDGTSWSTVFSSSASGYPPYTLDVIAPNEGYFVTCWGWGRWDGSSWSTVSQGFDFCDIYDTWAMRDAGGNLHWWAVGNNNFANGVRIWCFDPTTMSFGCKTCYCYGEGDTEYTGGALGIWGSSTDDVYVIGQLASVAYGPRAGRVYHFDGSNWSQVTSVGDIVPSGMWGTASNDVWIAGVNAKLLHLTDTVSNLPPVVVCNSITVTNDAGQCSATVTATQVGAGSYDPEGSPVTLVLTPPGPYPVGTNLVSLSATDTNGASASCTTAIVVIDGEAPVLTCVSNKQVQCGTAWSFDEPSATDNCGVAKVSITATITNGLCGGTFTATRWWQAEDNAGNAAACSQTVTLVDTAPPSLTCPPNLVLEFLNETGAVAMFTAVASDTCSLVTTVLAPPSGSMFPIGVTPVHVQALDACGNSNQCAFDVTVLGARGVKSNVLAQLVALRTSVTNRVDCWELSEAIEDMTDALGLDARNPLWVDETHVDRNKGGRVFVNEMVTVMELLEIIRCKKSGISDATAQDLIDRLVKCDRLLAVVSIQDAAKAGANSRKVADLVQIVAEGDRDAARGRPVQSIQDYWNAWILAAHLKN